MNFYSRNWRSASVDEIALLGAATLSLWILCILVFFAVLKPLALFPPTFPKSISFINVMLTMILIGGLRFSLELVFVLDTRIGKGVERGDALIAGAGVA